MFAMSNAMRCESVPLLCQWKIFSTGCCLSLLNVTFHILNHSHIFSVNYNSWICSIFSRGNPQDPLQASQEVTYALNRYAHTCEAVR